jgi:hypothetical protein
LRITVDTGELDGSSVAAISGEVASVASPSQQALDEAAGGAGFPVVAGAAADLAGSLVAAARAGAAYLTWLGEQVDHAAASYASNEARIAGSERLKATRP